jgi:hypothetical protein
VSTSFFFLIWFDIGLNCNFTSKFEQKRWKFQVKSELCVFLWVLWKLIRFDMKVWNKTVSHVPHWLIGCETINVDCERHFYFTPSWHKWLVLNEFEIERKFVPDWATNSWKPSYYTPEMHIIFILLYQCINRLYGVQKKKGNVRKWWMSVTVKRKQLIAFGQVEMDNRLNVFYR